MKKNYVGILFIVLTLTLLLTAAGCSPKAPAVVRLRLEITAPTTRSTVTESMVMVSGIISDAASKVTVNDTQVQTTSEGAFSYPAELAYGSNSIVVRASIEGKNPVSRTLTVTRNLELNIDSPEDNSIATEDLITISGKLSDPSAKLFINGSEATVAEDGTYTELLQLYYLTTTINFRTILEGVEPITKLVTVTKAL